MINTIDIQHACTPKVRIAQKILRHWVLQTLPADQKNARLTLRFVDSDEMIYLNQTYRNQAKTTNVLAFTTDLPPFIHHEYPLLGDVIVCPAVLKTECKALNKPFTEHCAHIIIHGVLHLLGHDHQRPTETQRMQRLEIKTLHQLGFNNPYATKEHCVK